MHNAAVTVLPWRSLGVLANIALFLAACSAVPPGPPVLSVDPVVQDLGVVRIGSSSTAEFRVANDGGTPLRITLKKADPNATAPAVTIVAPRRSMALKIGVKTLDLFGPAELPVAFETNDPARASLTLTVKGTFEPSVIAWPGTSRFEFVQGEKEGSVVQTLWSTTGGEFRVASAESPWPWLRVETREATAGERIADKEGSQWRTELTILPHAEVGPIAGHVKVRLAGVPQPVILLPVSGFVRPVLAATPHQVGFGSLKLGRQLERSSIDVQVFSTDLVTVTGVSSTVPGIVPTVTEVQTGRRYRIRLVITEEARAGAFSGKIIAATNSLRQPMLTIPMNGTFVE